MSYTKERTGWRDERISARHRKWGIGCTATDFDFLLLEYDFGRPSAIIEYKNEYAPPQYSSKPQYKALIRLGDDAKIPVIACRYSDDFAKYKVTPLNKYAKIFIPENSEFNEIDWVKLLYKIRGREVTQKFLESMKIEI